MLLQGQSREPCWSSRFWCTVYQPQAWWFKLNVNLLIVSFLLFRYSSLHSIRTDISLSGIIIKGCSLWIIDCTRDAVISFESNSDWAVLVGFGKINPPSFAGSASRSLAACFIQPCSNSTHDNGPWCLCSEHQFWASAWLRPVITIVMPQRTMHRSPGLFVSLSIRVKQQSGYEPKPRKKLVCSLHVH